MYGYPTIRNVTVKDSESYLCVSHEAEREWVQPLRLIAGLAAGPALMKIASDLPRAKSNLTFAIGLGMSVWSLSVYFRAKQRMDAYDRVAR